MLSFKADTHDAICIVQFFCTIMLKPKIIYESVSSKRVVCNKSHGVDGPLPTLSYTRPLKTCILGYLL